MSTMSVTRNLRATPADDGKFVATAFAGEKCTILETSADGLWVKVEMVDMFGAPIGWVSKAAVSDANPAALPVDKAAFVGECWHQSLVFGVNAHYLAAAGELRSHVTNDVSPSGEVGVFRILPTEWAATDWKSTEFGFTFTANEIGHWRNQATLFALMALRATQAFMDSQKSAGLPEKRPSTVELYLVQMIGVKALTELKSDMSQSIKTVLDKVGAALPPGGLSADKLITRYGKLLTLNGAPATGDQIVKQVTDGLDTALTSMRALVLSTGVETLAGATDAASASGGDAAKINFDASTIPAGRKSIAKQVVSAFADAGFGAVQQVSALANAIAESGLNPAAASPVTPNEASFGLFQLNTKGGGLGTGFSPAQLQQADVNIGIIVNEAKKIASFGVAASLADAVTAFVKAIEKPANPAAAIGIRLQIAQSLVS